MPDEGLLATLEENADLKRKKKGFNGGNTDGRVAPPSPHAGLKNSGDMDGEDQASARAIAGGVQAWKMLTHHKVPETLEPTSHSTDAWSLPPADGESNHEAEDVEDTHPTLSTTPSKAIGKNRGCPFSSTSNTLPPDHPSIQLPDSAIQRPDSLPTPPELHETPCEDPISQCAKQPHASSPPPSATGSTSKCPIRFLNHHPPEEVAEYFKNHKHEIPRSHEVCVKRYQRNSESIRQLDAKYGNLVSMIQGLGMKHQPLLPTKEEQQQEQEQIVTDHASQRKIEKWADDVGHVPESQAFAGTGAKAEGDAQADMKAKGKEEKRQGRFERPLREIRVGESPSRPWGIAMPLAADMAPSAMNALDGLVGGKGGEGEGPASMAPLPDVAAPHVSQVMNDKDRRMIFTGPVFFGYSAEQAAALVQQLGSGAKGLGGET